MRYTPIFIALTMITACKTTEAPMAPNPAPPAVARDTSVEGPQAQRAFEAMAAMKKQLGGKLKAALTEGGPATAVSVCKVEAPAIAKSTGATHGLTIGRMSHKLRNENNAPPPWAAAWMSDNGGKRSTEVKATTIVLDNDRLGVIKPIGTMGVCTKCHGDEATLAPGVKSALATSFPHDKAVGFAPGQLRGAFWAEVPAE